jgi:hypothetical protein
LAHFRLAFYWQEPDESQVADIDVYLDGMESDGVTVCSSGFVTQNDESINNAIHITSANVPSCASYIRIRIVAYGIPSGQSRVVYESDLVDNDSDW